MALLKTIQTYPQTSAEAIRIFDERYLAGVSAVEPDTWPEQYGDVFDVDSPDVKFPVGLLSAKYEETKGEARAKSMEEREIPLDTAEYDAGFDMPLKHIVANVFGARKWEKGPASLLKAEKNLVCDKLGEALEANDVCGWDDLSLFHDAHLINPADPDLGTFDNNQATAKDVVSITNIEEEVALMGEVRDENGRKMRARPTHIFVATPKAEALRNLLEQTIIVIGSDAGLSNPYKGKIQVVEIAELEDANDWYLFDANLAAQSLPPWVAIRYFHAALHGLRHFGEDSDFFKNSGKIKMTSHVEYGFRLMFPHAIRRVAGA